MSVWDLRWLWRRWAPAILWVGMGCAHPAGPAQTTTPTSGAVPAPSPTAAAPPVLHVALTSEGATLTLRGGSGCTTLPAVPHPDSLPGPEGAVALCPGQATAVSLERLGAITFAGGWVLPVARLPRPSAAELVLTSADDVVPLGPPERASAYLAPGPHTRALGAAGYVHLPPEATDSRFEAYETALARARDLLGEPRHPVLLLDGALSSLDEAVVAVPGRRHPLAAVLQAWLAGPPWWRQGLGAHLALVLRRGGGELEEPDAWSELMVRYHRHRRAPNESPRTATGQTAEDVGALVAFCLDVELARADRSLVAELRRADGPADLVARIAHDEPELAQRHRARVARRGVMDLDACLTLAGSRLVAHEVPVVAPARLLQVGALDEEEAAVTATGSGPLRAGDVIRHVRGLAVRHAWDIVFYLRDLQGRHRFSVSVQRGDRTIRAWLRMVTLDDDLPATVRFSAEPDQELQGDANPFADRAVRRAVAPVDDRR